MPKDEFNPQQPGQPIPDDNVAVKDRKASKGDDYAHEDNASAEGNDASLTSGPVTERRVPPQK